MIPGEQLSLVPGSGIDSGLLRKALN